MVEKNFEQLLAYHCAPTLMGIKAGNIFSIRCHNKKEIEELTDRYQKELASYDIFIENLCACENRALIYVYRKSELIKELNMPDRKAFLTGRGYEQVGDIRKVLDKLKERINQQSEFPHEIGVFLSYPIEDINGFILSGGKDYVFNGYWKVYSNAGKTKKLFEDFSKCRQFLRDGLNVGKNLRELLYTA